jgi:hypothetical protein
VGKRRWRARTPRLVGTPVAHCEGEASWSEEGRFRYYFAATRTRRAELAANLDYVEKVRRDSARKAGGEAGKAVQRARLACGLD